MHATQPGEAAMSATEVYNPSRDAAAGTVDMHLEVQIIPVSDVDRSKEFYQRLGWRLDADDAPLDGLRIVQFTPPGSGASVTFGTGLTTAAPGSAEGGLSSPTSKRRTTNSPAAASTPARSGTARRSHPTHASPAPTPTAPATGPSSPSPIPTATLWLVQEVTTRLPGRVDAAGTAFASTADLAGALRRAEAAHAEHHKRPGRSHLFHRPGQDEDWPAWYAAYLVAEQAGTDLPA